MDAEGNPVLRYHFSLQGKADALYQVRLYVDSNGNGFFEKEECSSEPIITDTTEGALNGTTANGTLLAGHSYTVERALPATQAGMLPWKLEVSAVDATSDRDSAIGYTRIVNYGSEGDHSCLADEPDSRHENGCDFGDPFCRPDNGSGCQVCGISGECRGF